MVMHNTYLVKEFNRLDGVRLFASILPIYADLETIMQPLLALMLSMVPYSQENLDQFREKRQVVWTPS
jgi:hypothetical protein